MVSVPNSQPLAFELPDDARRIALLMIDFQGDFCDPQSSFLSALGAAEGARQAANALEPARRVLVRVQDGIVE